MRLIDSDHLHEVYMKWFKKEMLNDEKISKTISWADALMRGEPIVDAVPVIRCKDCRWYKTNYSWDGKEHRICAIEPYEPVRKADDFCNRAERKEE